MSKLPQNIAEPSTKKAREIRDRNRPIKVWVTENERAEIERLAELAGLSRSSYLSAAGLNHKIQSQLDFQAVLELAKVAGDLGRFGGLLKLWLTDKRGQGAPAVDIERLLKEVRELQSQIRDRMGRV